MLPERATTSLRISGHQLCGELDGRSRRHRTRHLAVVPHNVTN